MSLAAGKYHAIGQTDCVFVLFDDWNVRYSCFHSTEGTTHLYFEKKTYIHFKLVGCYFISALLHHSQQKQKMHSSLVRKVILNILKRDTYAGIQE